MGLLGSIFNFLRFNKRNWKAIVLSIFAATVFWFFNALNKNYSANISFPVRFNYDYENYVPVKPLPTSIRMNVSGLGWDLFRKSSGLKVTPLEMPLPPETKKIIGSTLPTHFSGQLEGLQINYVLIDTIYVDIDERIRKKFNLTVDSAWRFLDEGYGVINDISVEPDTIWITGPAKLVNRLPEVINLLLPKNDIDDDFIGEVEVVFPFDYLIKREPPVVTVAFDVEKIMDLTDRIQLKMINVPPNVRPVMDLREVNCTFRLPVSLVKTFSSDSMTAVIDIDTLSPGKHRLVPRIRGLSKNARLVKIDSVSINF